MAPRRMYFVVLFLLSFSAAAIGQNAQIKSLVWSGDPNCGRRNFEPEIGERLSCQSIPTPRGNVSIVNHAELSLSVGFLEEDDYIIVATQLINRSDRPMDVDTDLWGAAHFLKPEGAFRGAKPIIAELAIPSRDIVRGISSGVAIDNSVDTFVAGITKTGEVREVRQADGTRIRKVVITEDADAKRIAGSRTDSRSILANSEQEKIRSSAFTRKWIPAQSSAKGLVYFRRVKKAGLVVFSFRVLDVNYVFRLLRNPS